MITIEIDVIILIIILLVWFIYTRLSENDTVKDWRTVLFIVGGLLFTLIWGGIFWW